MDQESIKKNFFCKLCSILSIAVLAVFLFLLRYDLPLYGDDIGALVANNPDSTYIDDRVVEGECTLDLDFSPKASWNRLRQSYFSWDGRVVTKLVTPLVRMIFALPDGMNWVIFAIYIAGMLFVMYLLTLWVICESIAAGMKESAIVFLTGLLLFCVPSYSYAYMSRLIMYTFTNIYVISVILYLVFYMLIRCVYERYAAIQADDGRTVQSDGQLCGTLTLIGINLSGALAGLSHEAYGVIFGVVLLTQMLRFWFNNNWKLRIRSMFLYPGYLIGFCICFFAPGNFNRAAQSHESALRTVPLFTRLFNSIYIHTYVAYKIWIFPAIVLPVLAVVLIALLYRRMLGWKEVFMAVIHNLEWYLGFAMSAVTWGIVARVMIYGMLAANVLLIIGVIRTFRELWQLAAERISASGKKNREARAVLAGMSLVAVMCLFFGYSSQILAVHRTADVWRENIGVARKMGMEEIEVPAYPEGLDHRFYDLNAMNDQRQYDRIAARVVYGTHVVLNTAAADEK